MKKVRETFGVSRTFDYLCTSYLTEYQTCQRLQEILIGEAQDLLPNHHPLTEV